MTSASLGTRDFARMALRTALLQATWNYERQQGLGWAWSLQPALERLYPDAATRRDRLAEHTAYFNTQPTLASLALGAVAGLEEQRSHGNGTVDAEAVRRVKSVLGSSLAALGDRLFWFTLRPFAACLGIGFALAGAPVLGALLQWLCYNALHLGVRVLGVGWGYRSGPAVLSAPVRARFERVVQTLGTTGALVIGALVALLLVPAEGPRPLGFQILLALGLAIGLVTAQRPRPSPTEYAFALTAVCIVVTWRS